jgi:hypothetical protein
VQELQNLPPVVSFQYLSRGQIIQDFRDAVLKQMHFWYLRRVTIYPVPLTFTNAETYEGEKFEKIRSLQAEDDLGSSIDLIVETEDILNNSI